MNIIKSASFLKISMLALILIISLPVQAASSDAANKVKAAIVFKITRFIQWSEATAADKVLNLCVLGDASLYSQLKTTEGKTSKGYNIKVKEVSTAQQSTSDCELLYIGASASQSTGTINQVLKTHPVLSVSDRTKFAKEGGMIQIKERGGRIRFTINLRSAKSAGLDVRSQLLGLANVIE
ncbi:YfiR family protein [Endozoicomonas sp.]|nr:YfiR family protein [Endozoicomonas sp.]